MVELTKTKSMIEYSYDVVLYPEIAMPRKTRVSRGGECPGMVPSRLSPPVEFPPEAQVGVTR